MGLVALGRKLLHGPNAGQGLFGQGGGLGVPLPDLAVRLLHAHPGETAADRDGGQDRDRHEGQPYGRVEQQDDRPDGEHDVPKDIQNLFGDGVLDQVGVAGEAREDVARLRGVEEGGFLREYGRVEAPSDAGDGPVSRLRLPQDPKEARETRQRHDSQQPQEQAERSYRRVRVAADIDIAIITTAAAVPVVNFSDREVDDPPRKRRYGQRHSRPKRHCEARP
mmetsp:Transcript_44882/g.94169  ORF Transcript_44882/g.94169 Transcript_44882/m.94169 type:complete len:222 (-) Transcript_44882:377-1042(-)